MTQIHTDTKKTKRAVEASASASLNHVRAAAQALHGAISDAATKSGEVLKADLQLLPEMARAVTDSIKKSIDAESETTRRQLTQARTYVEATQKDIAEGLRSSGLELERAIHRAMRAARAAAQDVSEAVADKRSVAAQGRDPSRTVSR